MHRFDVTVVSAKQMNTNTSSSDPLDAGVGAGEDDRQQPVSESVSVSKLQHSSFETVFEFDPDDWSDDAGEG